MAIHRHVLATYKDAHVTIKLIELHTSYPGTSTIQEFMITTVPKAPAKIVSSPPMPRKASVLKMYHQLIQNALDRVSA